MITLSEIKKLFKNEHVEVHMKGIRVNGNVRGTSGFVRHTKTNMIVYINTEDDFNMGTLYRCAKSLKDYQGASNNFVKTKDQLLVNVMGMLTSVTLHESYFGKDFWKPPKVVVPDHKRQIPGAVACF